jgi:hypothetical protein
MKARAYEWRDSGASLRELSSRLKQLGEDCMAKYGTNLLVEAEVLPGERGMSAAKLVCCHPRDVFRLADLFLSQEGITLVAKNLFLSDEAAPFGMRVIVKLPVPNGSGIKSAPFEIRIITQKADFKKQEVV